MARRISSLMLLLSLGLVGCDHATKHIAQTELRGRPPITLISNFLDLRYAENRDMAFSLLRDVPEQVRRPILLVGVSAGLCLVAFLWWRRRDARWPELLAYSFILAGALGNVSDRIVRGYVVDFVHVHRWPVFNVADACLLVGAGLLLLRGNRSRPIPEAHRA